MEPKPSVVIDGSMGEGGGQVLRTSLALSLVTGVPFRIEKIRGGRKKPGLMRQHLTAVEAAGRIGRARVEGASLGSMALTFEPGRVEPGEYSFAVGTAGSAMLVLQTVLPALLTAPEITRLRLEGGTHNPFAPPFEFLARAFLPLVERMGPRVEIELVRPGFYPAGGGLCEVVVHPTSSLRGFELLDRGEFRTRRARAMVASLPRHIAERELEVVRRRLGWEEVGSLDVVEVQGAQGPGNVLVLEIASENVTEVVTSFGERGRPAEAVAEAAVQEVERYLAANVPVGEHLADQLLLPLALAGGGSFRTLPPSRHTTTSIEVLSRFLDLRVSTEKVDDRSCLVSISRPPA